VVLHKIIAAAGHVKSYELAAQVLKLVGDIPISGRHVNRLTEEIGQELQDKRDRATEDHVHHRRAAVTAPAPQVVAVALDGGRIMTRTPGQGVGVHGQGWKEDKVACLLTLTGETFQEDPHPQPPRCFLDAPQVDELVRDIQARHGPRQENELPLLEELGLPKLQAGGAGPLPDPDAVAPAPTAPSPGPEALALVGTVDAAPAAPNPALSPPSPLSKPAWPPQRTAHARSCVATMRESAALGKMVVAEMWRRNFQAAQRGALLGDGSAWIWVLHGQWFRDLTAITDFVHVLTYLYVTAAVLTSSVRERWQWYVDWMTQCWQGRVVDVIGVLQGRLEALGPYPGGEAPPPTDAREVLRRTLTYLGNNQERMDYASYRQAGLPVTSSMVESLIKEVNYRVKGTEKFWDHPEGAEAILQVRAALLSEDERLAEHIQARPGRATRRHTRRKAA
jgi:hypothetical protein